MTMKTKPRIEIDLQKVEHYASLGLTQQQIADALGISRTTLQGRIRDSELFEQAIKRGQAKGVAFVASRLLEKVKERDTASIIFFLKTKGGYKETQKVEMTADVKTTEVELTAKQKATLDKVLDEDY